MRLFDLNRHTQRPGRPTRFHYWPIKFGWVRNSSHALICWHPWPARGSAIWPDASYKDCGWTLHIGAIKIYFGRM